MTDAITQPRERPILFQGDMVRALLAGTKTQTRRLVKPQPEAEHGGEPYWFIGGYRVWEYRATTALLRMGGNPLPCSYGEVADRLWVREAWRSTGDGGRCNGMPPRDMQAHEVWYEAGGAPPPEECAGKLRPSMFMPRWACRLVLEITEVRVERIQDISRADCLAEGIVALPDPHGNLHGYGLADGSHFHTTDPRASYWSLIDAINGPGTVERNVWLWAVSFKVIKP